MDQDRILEKIKKCMEMAKGKGSNPNEAEIALRLWGSRFPLPFEFGPQTRLLPLALAAGLALCCSAGPAWMAARLPPAEALRNE